MENKEIYAFPLALNVDEKECKGMTLRDYFANSAIQGILTTYNDQTSFDTFKHCANDLAITSYQIADAMLKQREL